MNHSIAGLILAGGRNTRMGGVDKSRISVDGVPLIRSISALLQALFPQVILVTNQPELHRDLPEGVVVTSDQFRGRGPLGGLHAGLSRSDADALFCVGCDMPSLRRDLIEAQVQEFHRMARGSCQVLIPRIGELIEPLHGIYLRTVEPQVREICDGPGGYSIRVLLARARTCYWDLENTPENRRAFVNLNTPKDLCVHLETSGR
ncbi:MAG: molybdenum cofactor guanylyltransferase [Spirochaetaceae bacterium]|nr:MAG: molybdenum cofactor guanylyltransferase [Spirochaetaceae bacterium]